MTSTDDEEPGKAELVVEVVGSPEEVWEAIATGPGISAWLHPTTVEEREGGTFTFDMGSGAGEQTGTVTGWEPPHRFVQQVVWGGTAHLATEWLVEAVGGGRCVVRVVMTGFGDTGWEDELDGVAAGMRLALEHLRLHQRWFAGGRPAWTRSSAVVAGLPDAAWSALLDGLGLAGRAPGQPVAAPGPPAFSGVVEQVVDGGTHRAVLVRTERPAPGVLQVFAIGPWLGVETALYGANAARLAAEHQPAWHAWVQAQLAAPTREPVD